MNLGIKRPEDKEFKKKESKIKLEVTNDDHQKKNIWEQPQPVFDKVSVFAVRIK